ncbi:MAG: hypothetical protein Ct9H300mP28_08560 [Pseudomonadota bacterium]|nr:MAG: hypothetical protein Ct9H300mP28_08560 [Pseudomonadota bacterium]
MKKNFSCISSLTDAYSGESPKSKILLDHFSCHKAAGDIFHVKCISILCCESYALDNRKDVNSRGYADLGHCNQFD